jgi:putative endonuclease
MQKQTYQYGIEAESKAIAHLESKGYKIISQRYKTKLGEIDIVAEIAQTLVFIEVKARKGQELIEVMLRKNQINRIRNAARFFLAKNIKYHNHDVRFDFILFEQTLDPQHFEAFFE